MTANDDAKIPLIYVVEDSLSSGALYCSYLTQAGYDTQHFTDGQSALDAIKTKMPDVVLQDVFLPDMNGLEVLSELKKLPSPAEVVVITSNSSIDVAVTAMRNGGFDFIEKPFNRERLLTSMANALEQATYTGIPEKVAIKKASLVSKYFVGDSLSMNTVFRMLDSAASSKASVFVTGESGTGKEVCAMALHATGARSKGPFIPMNCAAIPAELFESEFFGHVKGAFSGAMTDRKGAAESANGGTLFLDEICEMDLTLQAKLLRFLQTGTYNRVGSNKELHSDIRIVCATNRNPEEEVGLGNFREDLFYRLNVIPIKLPALRDRGNDILTLSEHFLKAKSEENDKQFISLSPEVKKLFSNYDWPGNVRELQNVIENVVVINNGKHVSLDMLPSSMSDNNYVQNKPKVSSSVASPHTATTYSSASDIKGIRPLEEAEREIIEQAISICEGNIPYAAACLGISASTIYRKIKNWE